MSLVSYLLGKLVPSGPAKGIEVGFLYIEDAFKLIEWGVTSGNLQAVTDALAASTAFESEFTAIMESASTPIALVIKLITQSDDPFANSRKLVQEANAKYSVQGFTPQAGL